MLGHLARLVHLAIGLLGTSRPFTVLHRSLYRRLEGRGILRGALGVDAVLLTTTGRRTGRARTVPLFAFPLPTAREGPGAARSTEPRSWIVVASNAGRRRAPGWYRNIDSDPAVEVQHGERHWRAMARIATGDERERLWALAMAGYPGYAVYRDRTRRTIPIVILEPR